MADETGTIDAQGADVAQATTGTSGAQGATSEQPPTAEPTSEPTQGAGESSEGPSVADLQAKIAELERDNAAYREGRRQRESAELSKLHARIAELEADLATRREREQEQSLRLVSQATASRLGFKDPDLAYELLRGNPQVDWKNDEPANIEKLLTDVAKARPYLLTSTDFGGGVRGASPAAPQDDFNQMIRRGAGRAS